MLCFRKERGKSGADLCVSEQTEGGAQKLKTVEYGIGNEDVLFLLHGGGLSWWNYEEVAELLEDRFHIVIPILDGHSGSDRPFTSIEDNAGEIIAHIDERFGGSVLLIGGLSLGGQILVEMLSQRSDICKFAIVESANAIRMKLTAALIKPVYTLFYPLVRKRWFAKLQFRYLRIKEEYFENYYADSSAISKNDMTAFLASNANYTLKDTLRDCKAKVLVVAGGKELRTMKNSAAMIADYLPASKMMILKGLHHGEFSLNYPGRYAEELVHLTGK